MNSSTAQFLSQVFVFVIAKFLEYEMMSDQMFDIFQFSIKSFLSKIIESIADETFLLENLIFKPKHIEVLLS